MRIIEVALGPDGWRASEIRATRHVNNEQPLNLFAKREDSGKILALTSCFVTYIPKSDSGEAVELSKLRPMSVAPVTWRP